jgi:hypothetical protein
LPPQPKDFHGEPSTVALVVGVVVAATLLFLWSLKAFGRHATARREALAFAEAVPVGATLADVRTAAASTASDEVSFKEILVTGGAPGARCDATLVIAKTPYEWGSKNWWVAAVLESERVTGVVVRSGVGVRVRPPDAPVDRDAAISPCVRGALAP